MPTTFDDDATIWDNGFTVFDAVVEESLSIELQNNIRLLAVPNRPEHLISAVEATPQAKVWAAAGLYSYVVPVTGTYWLAAAGAGGGRRSYTGASPAHHAGGGSGAVAEMTVRLTRGDRLVVEVGSGAPTISAPTFGTGNTGGTSQCGGRDSIYSGVAYWCRATGGSGGYINSATSRGGGSPGGWFCGQEENYFAGTGNNGAYGTANNTGTAPAGGAAVSRNATTVFGIMTCTSGAGQGASTEDSQGGMVVIAYIGR